MPSGRQASDRAGVTDGGDGARTRAQVPAPATESLLATIRLDFESFLNLDDEKTRSLSRRRFDVLSLPGFWAVVIFRISAVAHRAGLTPVARLLMVLNIVLFSCEISPRAQIGPGLALPHPQGMALGGGVVLGRRVRLLRGTAIGTAGYKDKRRDGFPVIGDDCTICDGVKVFGPVDVGARSTIGASVVLFESVPPDSTVVAHLPYEVRTAVRDAGGTTEGPAPDRPGGARRGANGAALPGRGGVRKV